MSRETTAWWFDPGHVAAAGRLRRRWFGALALILGCGSGQVGAGGETEPRAVQPCDALEAAGTWQDLTPSAVNLASDFKTPAGENYGVHSFVIDPQDTSVLYLGTSAQGVFRSADCGATWEHVNTGRNGVVLDSGRQWTLVIDPTNPDVLYTNTGYGQLGAWKSTNGGVDWDPLIQTDAIKALQFGGFVQYVRMDPTNHQHILVTPHFACEVGAVDGLPKTSACMLESKDGGTSWNILEGVPPAGEGASQKLLDSRVWFWAEGFGGLWRSGDGGGKWDHVYDGGYATASIYVRPDGSFLTGGVFSILASADGIQWSSMPGSPGTEFLTGDADVLFAARNGTVWSADPRNPTMWTELATPAYPSPDYIVTWDLKYDPDHHLLYSLNSRNGFWRYVVK